MNGRDQVLGIVEDGRFKCVDSGGSSRDYLRLTSIQIVEQRPPDSAELNLSECEGMAIMVSGKVDSDWVYSAAIDDRAGPILTAVVKKVFGWSSGKLGNG